MKTSLARHGFQQAILPQFCVQVQTPTLLRLWLEVHRKAHCSSCRFWNFCINELLLPAGSSNTIKGCSSALLLNTRTLVWLFIRRLGLASKLRGYLILIFCVGYSYAAGCSMLTYCPGLSYAQGLLDAHLSQGTELRFGICSIPTYYTEQSSRTTKVTKNDIAHRRIRNSRIIKGLHQCRMNKRAWVEVVFMTRYPKSCRVLPRCR